MAVAKNDPKATADAGEVTLEVRGWSSSVQDALDSRQASRICIKKGQRPFDLRRLVAYRADITHLAILTSEVSGIESISQLSRLVRLRAWCPVQDIDFARLVNLESCEIKTTSLGSVGQCPGLDVLSVEGVAMTDLRQLRGLARLRELECTGTKLVSLRGVDKLSGLKQLVVNAAPLETLDGLDNSAIEVLRLFYLPRLRSVSAVSQSALRVFALVNCKRVEDLDHIVLPALRMIALHGCGTLLTLRFLAHSNELQSIDVYRSSFKDGDLTFLGTLRKLERVRLRPFQDHYHPGRELVERGIHRPLMDLKAR